MSEAVHFPPKQGKQTSLSSFDSLRSLREAMFAGAGGGGRPCTPGQAVAICVLAPRPDARPPGFVAEHPPRRQHCGTLSLRMRFFFPILNISDGEMLSNVIL